MTVNGEPHLSIDQHKRLFNIIYLESRINELEKMHENYSHLREVYLRKESLKKQLDKLTNCDHAANVMTDMVEKSKRD